VIWFGTIQQSRFFSGVPQSIRRPDILRKWRRRNLITLTALFAFISGVFCFTIAKVKQDTFEDLDEKGNPKEITNK
jgi:hypothetical protein